MEEHMEWVSLLVPLVYAKQAAHNAETLGGPEHMRGRHCMPRKF